MNAIETRNLTKIYKATLDTPEVRSLEGLDLSVAENEVYGFVGRNGAGKTTTIKLLCSLIAPTAGDALIFGEPARTTVARKRVGYLPESPYFYEYLTPRETIEFYARLQGLDTADRAAQWRRLSEMFDLEPIADQRVRSFSKGMRQRLGFAVALVGDPDVLILDEPMSGLDPLGRRDTRNLIQRLRTEGKTIFFSSHVLSDVEQICDRVGVIVKGRMTSQGKLGELLSERLHCVEVTAANLTESLFKNLRSAALSTQEVPAGVTLTFATMEAADKAVRAIHAEGGALLGFSPVRESLEEYFMREQEAK